MKRYTITPQFVEFIPEVLGDDVLYISERYKIATHRCCCGCRSEVVTPLSPADWSLRLEGSAVTLHPSIGNWNLPCHSHYWILRNRVVWAGVASDKEIARIQKRDQADREAYIAQMNRQKEPRLNPSSGRSIGHRFGRMILAIVYALFRKRG